MEYSKKYRWALTGFIILLLLNVGTLATIWMIRPPKPFAGFNNEQPRRVQRFLARELDLSNEQKARMEVLREQHFQRIRAVRNEIRKSRATYFDLIQSADSISVDARIDSLAVRIGKAHAELERANYRHFRRMRKVLNAGQRSKFNRLLQQSMRGPKHGNGPGMMREPG